LLREDKHPLLREDKHPLLREDKHLAGGQATLAA